MKVYKKVRVLSDGNLYPLFIDKKKPFRFGEWLHCEFHPTKGFSPRCISEDIKGGWHCCFRPVAPHLNDVLSSGERRVWMECEARGEMVTYDRPESQGGAWLLAEEIMPVRVLSEEEVKTLSQPLPLWRGVALIA